MSPEVVSVPCWKHGRDYQPACRACCDAQCHCSLHTRSEWRKSCPACRELWERRRVLMAARAQLKLAEFKRCQQERRQRLIAMIRRAYERELEQALKGAAWRTKAGSGLRLRQR